MGKTTKCTNALAYTAGADTRDKHAHAQTHKPTIWSAHCAAYLLHTLITAQPQQICAYTSARTGHLPALSMAAKKSDAPARMHLCAGCEIATADPDATALGRNGLLADCSVENQWRIPTRKREGWTYDCGCVRARGVPGRVTHASAKMRSARK